MISIIEHYPDMADLIEEVLLIYPFSYVIRFKLAEQYEKAGKTKEARAHFEALRKARENFDDGCSEIADFEYGYVAAWTDALKARSTMKRTI